MLFVVLFIKFLVELRGSNLNGGEKGQEFIQILILALIILVIAVPEGLPLAVTLALAYATTRMLKDHNLVRVLRACETMGNATTICSDKTGTLTQNKMTVVAVTLGVSHSDCNTALQNSLRYLSELPDEVKALLRQSIAINSTAFESTDAYGGKEFIGSKSETSLLELSQTYLGMDNLSTERNNISVVQMFPFSSERKRMGAVVKLPKTYRLFVKGASEIVLTRCAHVLSSMDMSTNTLSEHDRQSIRDTIDSYASQPLRTIGLAYRDFSKWPNDLDVDTSMTWIGVMGIRDPLRSGVVKAVRDCQHAGVFVRMVTGDNVVTAKAIATECGIFTAGGIIMEGPQFRTLDPLQMDQILPRLQVLARSSPEDKRILVSRLKRLGNTVAVTGDGTNDGPALRTADVGFSMGIAGTEVAKEASSIILMDDDFASIVKAILWGRCVNDAVKKFLQVIPPAI